MALGLVNLAVALPIHGLVLRRHPEDLGLWPDGTREPPRSPSTGLSGVACREALRRGAFWTLTAAFALSTLAASVLLAHGVAYLIGLGYDPVLAASLAGLIGLASLPGRFLLNLLGDHLGPERVLGLCLATQAAGVILLLHGETLGWLIAYVVVYGAAYGAISPLKAAVMADQFGRRAYGAITAVQGVPVALSAGAGPVAAGWLYDRLGSYALPFWLCTAAFLAAGLGVVLTPRPAPSPR